MNKTLWRLVKIVGSIVLLILVILTILNLCKEYFSRYSSVFKQEIDIRKVRFIDEKFHQAFSKLSANAPKGKVLDGEKGQQINTVKVNAQSSNVKLDDLQPPQFSFVNNIMKVPQQQHLYNHVPSKVVWPNETSSADDRIISQMMLKMPENKPQSMKKILVYTGLRDGMTQGQQSFIDRDCPVNQCSLVDMRSEASDAHLILWQGYISVPPEPRPPGQIWMVFLLESPYHTPGLASMNNLVNWTGTYRRDSTVVAPYERFTLFNSSINQLPQTKNYAAGKTKKVAWFVSNCGARNNRLGYAKELQKFIQVDIYGACGDNQCPRSSGDDCFNLLSKDYKFYLAFENSNCRDYITEKFFVNGLKNDVLPIVMGAHPDDYRVSAPRHSYIHVDDFESPEALAKYLNELDKDDTKYNEYFRWKGTGDNINTHFWCRLCAMVHAADYSKPHVYKDLETWWRGPSVCRELDSSHLWPKW